MRFFISEARKTIIDFDEVVAVIPQSPANTTIVIFRYQDEPLAISDTNVGRQVTAAFLKYAEARNE